MQRIVYYSSTPERPSHYDQWFRKLDAATARRIDKAMRLWMFGKKPNIKPIHSQSGLQEVRIAQYRLYFVYDQDGTVVILHCGEKGHGKDGGSKRQRRDIETAERRWEAYQQEREV